VLTAADAVGLVVDPDVAAGADSFVESLPRRQVWIVRILCERFELIEAARTGGVVAFGAALRAQIDYVKSAEMSARSAAAAREEQMLTRINQRGLNLQQLATAGRSSRRARTVSKMSRATYIM
jgi:hypothetical protein